MEYKGKVICGLEVYDETNDNEVIACISDDKIQTSNGYKVRIMPHIEEKCTESE